VVGYIPEWFTHSTGSQPSKQSDPDCGCLYLSLCMSVIFNRGFAEPKGSTSVCQGFHSWLVKNKLACEIRSDNVVETQHRILCLKLCFRASISAYIYRVKSFLLLVFLTYLHLGLYYNVGSLYA